MSISSSDSDVEMYSAYSVPINGSHDKIGGVEDDNAYIQEERRMKEPIPPSAPKPGKDEALILDILDRIPKMHRLLDLRNDDGSNGIG